MISPKGSDSSSDRSARILSMIRDNLSSHNEPMPQMNADLESYTHTKSSSKSSSKSMPIEGRVSAPLWGHP